MGSSTTAECQCHVSELRYVHVLPQGGDIWLHAFPTRWPQGSRLSQPPPGEACIRAGAAPQKLSRSLWLWLLAAGCWLLAAAAVAAVAAAAAGGGGAVSLSLRLWWWWLLLLPLSW